MEAPHCDWLADAFSAFANSRGGMFVLGVNKNSRDVTGIPIECLDAVAELVCAACTESVDPPIVDIVVERLRLRASTGNELPVIRVEIPQSLFVHRSPGGYLYRTENALRAMSLEYLSRLTEQRSRARVIRFDKQPISGAAVDDLAPDLWQRFRTSRSDGDREHISPQAPNGACGREGYAPTDSHGSVDGVDRSAAMDTERLCPGGGISRERRSGLLT